MSKTFYEQIAAQTTREWAVVTTRPDGSPVVIAAYTEHKQAVNVVCELNQRGNAQTFVVYVLQGE